MRKILLIVLFVFTMGSLQAQKSNTESSTIELPNTWKVVVLDAGTAQAYLLNTITGELYFIHRDNKELVKEKK